MGGLSRGTTKAGEGSCLVHRLCCLRGVSTLTGFVLAVEIGDWHRFTGNTIGAFVGLVPRRAVSETAEIKAHTVALTWSSAHAGDTSTFSGREMRRCQV